MPIYEYRCQRGHTFEVMQRMSDDPIVSCQTCEAPVERVFHPVAVHFKGSGFYNTDYGTRRRAREKAAESAGADGTGTGKDSGSTSDSGSSDSKSTASESKSKQSKAKAASSSVSTH